MSPPHYGRAVAHPYSRERRPDREEQQASLGQNVPSGLSDLGAMMDNSAVSGFMDNTFEVAIKRNTLGLGLSITGGPEAPAPWTNLIRVKKVFPLQPAWETGRIKVGDVILRVCGIPLYSLTIRQALDILRSSPSNTVLQMCRIPDASCSSSPPKMVTPRNVVRSYSYGPNSVLSSSSFNQSFDWPGAAASRCTPLKKNSDPCGTYLPSFDAVMGAQQLQHGATPPMSTVWQSGSSHISPCQFTLEGEENEDVEMQEEQVLEREWSPQLDQDTHTLDLLRPVEIALKNSNSKPVGEFSIVLRKVNGSLGFTLLTSADDTVLKHTVKALVKEPAVSDGRIQPGDKLITANSTDLSDMSHQEVISFLRKCPEEVTLQLYRDASRSQTPLTPETPAIIQTQPSFNSITTSASCTNMSSLASRMSQSPSRKHLRYEARELVRSLQSSRTSLEKAGLAGSKPGSYNSGGTLGRRLGRPFSPASANRERTASANRDRNMPANKEPADASANRERAMSAGRDKNLNLGVKLKDEKTLFLSPDSPVPRIESPVTPVTLGEQVSQALNKLQLDERIQIEEINDDLSVMSEAQDIGSPSLLQVVQSPVTPYETGPDFGSSSSASLDATGSQYLAYASGHARGQTRYSEVGSHHSQMEDDQNNNNGETQFALNCTSSHLNVGRHQAMDRPNRLGLFEAESFKRKGYLFNSRSDQETSDHQEDHTDL